MGGAAADTGLRRCCGGPELQTWAAGPTRELGERDWADLWAGRQVCGLTRLGFEYGVQNKAQGFAALFVFQYTTGFSAPAVPPVFNHAQIFGKFPQHRKTSGGQPHTSGKPDDL